MISAILHTRDPYLILDHLEAYGLNATLIRLNTFVDLGTSYPEMFPRHRHPWLDGRSLLALALFLPSAWRYGAPGVSAGDDH